MKSGAILITVAALLLAAAASAAEKTDWKKEWEKTLAAAHKEGTVVLAGPAPPAYREGLGVFQKVFPEIRLEYAPSSGRDFAPRILAERRAAKFLWDVHIGGAGTPNQMLKPEGVIDPLMPALILPDVLDNDAWSGGFADGWMDQEDRYIYAFSGRVTPQVQVNWDVVSSRELTKVEDLLDPKWRGKISWNEPRAQGSGGAVAGYWLYLFGEDFFRKLLKQDIAPVRDLRQQAEWAVRARYPIAIGVDDTYLKIFQDQGVGRNIKPFAFETPAGGGRIGPGFGTILLVNRAPHPNAAKVFINWVLSREGQTAYVKASEINTRRLDVTVGPPETQPKKGIKYFNINKEINNHYQAKAIAIAKEILK
jgi:iron(III) transport system substrate-binding protein